MSKQREDSMTYFTSHSLWLNQAQSFNFELGQDELLALALERGFVTEVGEDCYELNEAYGNDSQVKGEQAVEQITEPSTAELFDALERKDEIRTAKWLRESRAPMVVIEQYARLWLEADDPSFDWKRFMQAADYTK